MVAAEWQINTSGGDYCWTVAGDDYCETLLVPHFKTRNQAELGTDVRAASWIKYELFSKHIGRYPSEINSYLF